MRLQCLRLVSRVLVVWPTPEGARLLIIGRAKNDDSKQMVGQLFDWGTGG